jgi:hypothetical protein
MAEFDATRTDIHLHRITVSDNPQTVVVSQPEFEHTVWVYATPRAGEMLTFADDKLWLVNLDSNDKQFLTETQAWIYVGFIRMRWSADNEWLSLVGATPDKRGLLKVMRRDGHEYGVYLLPLDALSNNWFISDFDWPHSVTLNSVEDDGLVCIIQLSTGEVDCRTGADTRRFRSRPLD